MATRLTPMMKQYMDVKKEHPDKFVLFRMGDFYELFFDDAREASRILGIALTSREKGENAVPMAGVPHHSVETYIRKFLEEGHKVVICEQVEDPAEARGLVKREVTRIITPGTYFSEDGEGGDENVFLGAVVKAGKGAGLAVTDLSTGEFFADSLAPEEAVEELVRMRVQECLVPEDSGEAYREVEAALGRERITEVPGWTFRYETARDTLLEHFGVRTLAGFGFDEEQHAAALCAAGAALRYLQETQKEKLSHIIKVTPLARRNYLYIDPASQRSLDLVEGPGGGRKNTLFEVLDFTGTPMGKRRLKQWILRPLVDCGEIAARREAVAELVDDLVLREELRELFRGVYDVERLAAKISSRRCTARDLVHLKNSMENVGLVRESLGNAVSSRLRDLRDGLAADPGVTAPVAERIVDDPPLQVTEGGIIRPGVDEELDELRAVSTDGKKWITEYQKKERERTGIEKLRVGYNKVFGYYIEVTNAHKDRVPSDYVRKQTLVNAERFITPELKEYEQKVLSAEERIKKIEYRIFQETVDAVERHMKEILRVASCAAELDVLVSLAAAASTYGYRAPVVDDSTAVRIRDGCHPVLLKSMEEGTFVPNDLFLDGENESFLVVTGPNMSGKSTYIRQAALLIIMAQMGSFVPAREAVIGVVDKIFTRIGASDEISRGRSTFMVEMTEVANILHNATPRSFIVLDEVGRGTSTFDGVSIAWAVAEYIVERIKARTLFATHYHELTELAVTLPRVKNVNVAVREWNGKVIFLHKIVEGIADKSYGIHVADIAGIPAPVIERAREVLENLEAGSMNEHLLPRLAERRDKEEEVVHLSLFDMKNRRVLERLKGIDVNTLTPLEALNLLASLQKEVE